MKIYPLTDMVGFDSKPTLFVVATRCRGNRKCISLSDTVKAVSVLTLNRPFLWLQRDVEVTGNVFHCPILSKLKLGLELTELYQIAFFFIEKRALFAYKYGKLNLISS